MDAHCCICRWHTGCSARWPQHVSGPPPLITPHNPSQKFIEPRGSMTPWSGSWESELEAKYKIQKWHQIRWQWLFSAQEIQVILDGLYPCGIRWSTVIWRATSCMVGSFSLIDSKIIIPPMISQCHSGNFSKLLNGTQPFRRQMVYQIHHQNKPWNTCNTNFLWKIQDLNVIFINQKKF